MKSPAQSLFEILIAVSVASLILISMISVVSRSTQLTSASRNQSLASRYAQEALDWIRNERDSTTWDMFKTNYSGSPPGGNTICLDSSPIISFTVGSCSAGDYINATPPLLREMTLVDSVSGDQVDITTRVYWQDATGVHEVVQNTILTNWR